MSTPKRILIVEDEAIIALDMESTLTDLGHDVTLASSAEEAIRLALAGNIDLAIVDYHLKAGNTDELAKELRRASIQFIVCSGSTGLQELGEVFQGTTFLAKPFTTDGLMGAISNATQKTGNDLH